MFFLGVVFWFVLGSFCCFLWRFGVVLWFVLFSWCFLFGLVGLFCWVCVVGLGVLCFFVFLLASVCRFKRFGCFSGRVTCLFG